MEENKYKDALERAREIYFNKEYKPNEAALVKETLAELFPELRESEDERIRIFLHKTFTAQYLANDKLGRWHNEPVTNILAYLEKLKDFNKRLEQAYKTADEVQYNRGYRAAMDEMEMSRLTACENQTEAEAKREMDFALDFFKKNKRQPTYSDCIEETRKKMIKEVTKWLEDHAPLYYHVDWDKKVSYLKRKEMQIDLRKAMGL